MIYVLFYNESYSKIPELKFYIVIYLFLYIVFICNTDLLNGPSSTGVLLLIFHSYSVYV